MPDNFHPHLKSNEHIGPSVSLPVCLLGGLDLWFFSYKHVQNCVGFLTGSISYEKQGIWGFVACCRADHRKGPLDRWTRTTTSTSFLFWARALRKCRSPNLKRMLSTENSYWYSSTSSNLKVPFRHFLCTLLPFVWSKIRLFFFAEGWRCWWANSEFSWDEAFSMFAAWKLADSMERAISIKELGETVDFSRRRRRRSVLEWQCSIRWSLIASSSEYLSKSQCSPSRCRRVTYWRIGSLGAWWAGLAKGVSFEWLTLLRSEASVQCGKRLHVASSSVR